MLLKKKLLRNSILSVVIVLSLGACETNTAYHSYQHIPERGWAKDDTLFFPFPVTDSVSSYQFTVEVRNYDNYPYQDLFLFINRPNTVDSTRYVTDTIKCVLAARQGNGKAQDWAHSISLPILI